VFHEFDHKLRLFADVFEDLTEFENDLCWGRQPVDALESWLRNGLEWKKVTIAKQTYVK